MKFMLYAKLPGDTRFGVVSKDYTRYKISKTHAAKLDSFDFACVKAREIATSVRGIVQVRSEKGKVLYEVNEIETLAQYLGRKLLPNYWRD